MQTFFFQNQRYYLKIRSKLHLNINNTYIFATRVIGFSLCVCVWVSVIDNLYILTFKRCSNQFEIYQSRPNCQLQCLFIKLFDVAMSGLFVFTVHDQTLICFSMKFTIKFLNRKKNHRQYFIGYDNTIVCPHNTLFWTIVYLL